MIEAKSKEGESRREVKNSQYSPKTGNEIKNNKLNNPMRKIIIEKITLNIGVGKDKAMMEKALKLLKKITNAKPIKTKTSKRIPTWDLRPGLEIGCKVTVRGKRAEELLKRLLFAKDNKLSEDNFDENGNFAFGIHEYIDIEGIKYDHDIGMMGLSVSVSLGRRGFRVKRRKVKKTKIGKKHRITKQEAIEFIKQKFNVKVGEDDI